MSELLHNVARNIRACREVRGLTQAQLAEAACRSVDMVSRLERGDATPSLDTLSKIAGVLSVSVSALMADRTGQQPALDRLAHRLSSLTDAEVAWLETLLDHLDHRP
jgi:transcriptional regulator with XRE-family HTH domain